MKTFLPILAVVLALSMSAPAAPISKADIIKTVQHLQERCHEAEAAQTAAENKLIAAQDHATQLQAQINNLAAHDQAETARANSKAAECKTLAARLDKLVLALAVASGLLVWSISSKFASSVLPAPYNLIGPIGIGIVAGMAVGAWLRYVL